IPALGAAVSWLLTSRYLLYSFTCRSVILLPGTQFPSTFTSRAHCSHASGTARSRSTGQDSCRQPVRLIVAGHLNQKQLAARWSISEATLERWRSVGIGPKFLKLCGRVIYRQVDIEAYEE